MKIPNDANDANIADYIDDPIAVSNARQNEFLRDWDEKGKTK